MKRFVCVIALFFCVFYLYTMNSTENRQSLADFDENSSYMQFARSYIESNGDSNNQLIFKCHTVYQGLIHGNPTQWSNDDLVKQRLVKMGLCELDQDVLVLKGFHIEDNLRALVCSRRNRGKK